MRVSQPFVSKRTDKTRTANFEHIPYQVLSISSRKPGDNQATDKSHRKRQTDTQNRPRQPDKETDRGTDTGYVIISSGIAKNTKN